MTGRSRSALVASAIVVGGYLLVALPVILWPHFDMRGRGAFDEINYHLRVIDLFAEQLPAPDVSDYLSATTPGYHVLMSLPRAAGVGVRALRVCGLVFPLALFVLLAHVLAARAPSLSAGRLAALICPVAASMYVVHAGIWLLPDDAAWLGAACVLALAFRPKVDVWFYVGGAIALSYLVLMRQIHLWAAAPFWTAAWLGAAGPEDGSLRALFKDVGQRVPRGVAALAASLPAVAIVGGFVLLWGGLVPPTFQARMDSANPVTPAFILALFGVYSVFFAPLIAPALFELMKRHPVALAAVLGAALVILAAPASSMDQEAGRWTGLWRLVGKAPTFADRSPVLIGLGLIGATCLAGWFCALTPRARWIAAAALLGFTAAQTASHEVWQRYNEPFLLILLTMMSVHRREMRETRLTALGPACLGLLLAGVTALSLVSTWREEPRRVIPLDELQDVIDRTVSSRDSAGDEKMGKTP